MGYGDKDSRYLLPFFAAGFTGRWSCRLRNAGAARAVRAREFDTPSNSVIRVNAVCADGVAASAWLFTRALGGAKNKRHNPVAMIK